jgi:secreted trypsin-like serine protease
VTAVLALVLAPAASASYVTRHAPPHATRSAAIYNGSLASAGEYPAQGGLAIDTDVTTPGYESACGGTLVGTRQFLTAAKCVTSGDTAATAIPGARLIVVLGDLTPATAPDQDAYAVVANDVNAGLEPPRLQERHRDVEARPARRRV